MEDGFTKFRHLPVHFQSAGREEGIDHLAVVDDLDVESVLPVVVLQRREAVRALGDDFGYPFVPEQLDILFRHGIKDIFVPQASETVAAALLLLAEDPPGDPGGIENGGQGHGHLLLP